MRSIPSEGRLLDPVEILEWLGETRVEMQDQALVEFIRESNRIEGIRRPPSLVELKAHQEFLNRPMKPASEEEAYVLITSLIQFVNTIQPGAVLRNKKGLDVRVGDHIAPRGDPNIQSKLYGILWNGSLNAWGRHCQYETLHPFTDGNGRSGRVLWLREMGGIESVSLGFLHHFYYQTLSHAR